MSAETANALRAARASIDTPEKWEASKALEQYLDDDACCALDRECQEVNFDTATHADIMALFDRAIAAEEEQP